MTDIVWLSDIIGQRTYGTLSPANAALVREMWKWVDDREVRKTSRTLPTRWDGQYGLMFDNNRDIVEFKLRFSDLIEEVERL